MGLTSAATSIPGPMSMQATGFELYLLVKPQPLFRREVAASREVLHGVGADGVGVKFPIFAVNCCCLPLSFRRSREMRKKGGKMRKKGEKCVKKGENQFDPIYTNPVKNLPSQADPTHNRICTTRFE